MVGKTGEDWGLTMSQKQEQEIQRNLYDMLKEIAAGLVAQAGNQATDRNGRVRISAWVSKGTAAKLEKLSMLKFLDLEPELPIKDGS